ncbi:MAG TPA: adenylate/guanylate cyclase domain-containing protein [Vicinamibacterales bacterium]|nr:adenylate/guanylate cyclase domain-containing protein [Vicinamibacterales bacterium]
MTIGRRLTAAFLMILMLFAVNEGIQLWSALLRGHTMATLDRALKRQVLIAAVRSRVSDMQKQMSLLGQIDSDSAPMPGGQDSLKGDIAKVSDDIRGLVSLSDPSDRAAVTELQHTFKDLAEAWSRFYDYLGVEPAWSLAFQVKAEPLGRRVILQLLPQLDLLQKQRVEHAEARYASVSTLTERVTFGIFVASMLLAAGIAYLLSRYLRTRLNQLKVGATNIGSMNLEHRIVMDSRDELGALAGAFNDMAQSLSEARASLTAANGELTVRNSEIERQRHVSESLLLNILPAQVAAELAARGEVAPRYFEDVTILFTDFVGFTLATEKLAADEVVGVLHGFFKSFDEIAERYGLEKLKTIGDSYFCAGGLPVRNPSHPVDATLAAFEMIREVEQRVLPDGTRWAVRIGLHTGPVVAGVVGTKKFAFDVWGDTVNRASRVESAGTPNRINVSSEMQRRIKDFFTTESRGRLMTKDKAELEMFLVGGIVPGLAGVAGVPPPAFAQRYRTYFDKELAAFPAFLVAGERAAIPPVAAT